MRLRIVINTITFMFFLIGCRAPSGQQWKMIFVTPEDEEVIARISTDDLFAGQSDLVILQTHKFPIQDNSRLKRISSVHRSTHFRKIGESRISAGPGCSGYFTVKDEQTGEKISGAKTGHSYSSLWGISPCGEYLAYFVPGAFWRRSYIHHLESKRRALIDVPEGWKVKEWTNATGSM
ncbi:MAG: hypothetical protein MI923_24820 [Phycisphaerales bacterium]|nr:hypothetical protein [Phycisphaerales bacterium]